MVIPLRPALPAVRRAATGIAGGARAVVSQPRKVAVHLPVAALILAYILRFSVLSVAVHDGYGTPAFDMAIPDQSIWLMSRFHAPYNTVMGRNFFGDHASYIFALLVPLYWVYANAAVLLVVQSIFLGLGAVPIYLYARRRLASTTLATLLAASYLLNPALQNGNLEQVHVEFFTVFLVALAIYAALESKGRLLAVSAILLMLCKEDTALLVIPLAAWVAWRRNRLWGIRLAVLGVVGAVLSSASIYAIVGVINVHTGRIPFGGLGGLARTAVTQPGRLVAYLRRSGRPFYVWQMLFSAGLVLLRAPEIAAIGILTLTVNVVTPFVYQHQIQYHYSLPLVPVLCLGTAFAIAKLRTLGRRRVATVAVTVCSLWACYLWGLAPFSIHTYPHLSTRSAEVRAINAVEAALPPHAVVSAYYPYVSHLDHRTRIYMWPNPFSAQYWDRFQEEGRRLPFANQVQYVLLPTDLTGNDAAVWAANRRQFRVVKQVGDVALYKRR
ncbi:MAG: DUF2079 domain-containing protein [Acidimicrobiales bacterium]